MLLIPSYTSLLWTNQAMSLRFFSSVEKLWAFGWKRTYFGLNQTRPDDCGFRVPWFWNSPYLVLHWVELFQTELVCNLDIELLVEEQVAAVTKRVFYSFILYTKWIIFWIRRPYSQSLILWSPPITRAALKNYPEIVQNVLAYIVIDICTTIPLNNTTTLGAPLDSVGFKCNSRG